MSAAFEFGYESYKLDGCAKEYNLTLWADLLNATGRAFLIENCHWGYTLPTATYCPWSYYRSSGDIRANYGAVVNNLQTVVPLATQNLSYPNCWAFPDALEVGVYNGPGGTGGDSGLSYAEARSHFGAWCVVSSPLILGIDTTNATAMDAVWDIITNNETIAVNQAYYGTSGNMYTQASATVDIAIPAPARPSRSAEFGGLEDPSSVTVAAWQLFAKPLSATSVAVLAMNNAATTTSVTIDFSAVPGLPAAASYSLRDIYNHAELGSFSSSYTANLDSHDSAFVIISA